MVEIFQIENSIVRPTTHILLISPFKEIWERDTSKHKETAIREFSYIEFMVSPKKSNPYHGYEESIKEQKIIEGIWKEEIWTPDDEVKKAVEQYKLWLREASPSWKYFLTIKKSVEKVRVFLDTVNLNERDDKGKPIFKVGEIIAAQTKADEVLKNLNNLEQRVLQELFESMKTKGGKEINVFEK